MTSPSANVTDVVFDFCGVLIDWQTRACLEGRYPQVVVDRICADNDPCGFYDYEDRMDHGDCSDLAVLANLANTAGSSKYIEGLSGFIPDRPSFRISTHTSAHPI